MKIAVSGKGGVGKSTVASMIARTWAEMGSEVLAIDADPDSDLPFLLGFDSVQIPKISQMRDLIKARMGGGSFFTLDPQVDDILDKFAVRRGNLRLLVLGGIEEADKGCACPENFFLKSLIRHIALTEDSHLIVDFPAGIEHLGRGAAKGIDLMLIVVEPMMTAIASYHRISALAKELGIEKIAVIVNKIHNNNDIYLIINNITSVIIAEVPYSEEILAVSKGEREGIPCRKVWEGMIGMMNAE
jgi:CO dehydrogenase maturation factor